MSMSITSDTEPRSIGDIRKICGNLIRQGKPREAVAAAREFVLRAPAVPAAHMILARSLKAANLNDSAVEASQKALDLGLKNVDGILFHIRLLSRLGRPKKALVQIDALPAQVQSRDGIVLLKVRLLNRIGQTREAIKLLQNALPSVKDETPFLRLRTEIAVSGRNPRAAIAAFSEEVDRSPSDPNLVLTLSRALIADKQYDRARQSLTAARQRFPDHLDVGIELARLLFDIGDMEKAREAAHAVIEINGAGMLETLDENLLQARRAASLKPEEPELATKIWPCLKRPENQRKQWLADFNTGRHLNKAIRDWVLSRQGAIGELDTMVDQPDWGLLGSALEAGRGVVLCFPHLGPRHVAAEYLARHDWPLIFLSNNLFFGLVHGDTRFRSAEQIGAKTILEFREHLQRPGIVFLAPDGGYGDDPIVGNVFNKQIYLKRGAPDLAFWSGAQTAWCAASWKEERLEIKLKLGPAPEQGEKIEPWRERWSKFYCGQIEEMIAASPFNIRMEYARRLVDKK